MRKLLLLAAAVPVFTLTPAFAATKTVDINKNGFTPKNATIDLGDTVTWTNRDTAPHQVVSDQAKFTSSALLQPAQTYSVVFTKSGAFPYHDGVNANRKGTITVRQGVTLGATPPVVTYGKSATLLGVVSTGATGESVTVNAQECGKTSYTRVATINTTANGGWTFIAKPTLNTKYQAGWRNTKSAELTEKVAPSVALRRVRAGRFLATVTAAQSFAGKYVVLQRFVRTKRVWKTVKRVTLKTVKTGTTPTMITSAGFRSKVARRTKLRLLLPQTQAGACYAPGRSPAIRA
jgi:plastocyanin